MKTNMNSYVAILFVTIAGAAASLLILHVAMSSTLAATVNGNEAGYATLQKNILNH